VAGPGGLVGRGVWGCASRRGGPPGLPPVSAARAGFGSGAARRRRPRAAMGKGAPTQRLPNGTQYVLLRNVTAIKRKSDVWNRFYIVADPSSKLSLGLVQCKQCGQHMKYEGSKNGTSNLRRHRCRTFGGPGEFPSALS